MECQKHPGQPMQVICGENVCGHCDGERWAVERLPSLIQSPEPIDMSKGMFGRDEHHVPPVE